MFFELVIDGAVSIEMLDEGDGLAANIDKLQYIADQPKGGKRFKTGRVFAAWRMGFGEMEMVSLSCSNTWTVRLSDRASFMQALT